MTNYKENVITNKQEVYDIRYVELLKVCKKELSFDGSDLLVNRVKKTSRHLWPREGDIIIMYLVLISITYFVYLSYYLIIKTCIQLICAF